ncbi:MAG: helix-turn-helix transcriptional regulator, partial [Eubacteriales bacterium]
MEYKICETIKTLRRERSISQEVLAAAVGVSVQAVSKWECGGSLPDILTLPEIARYFGVTTDTLYYGITENGENSACVALPSPSEAPPCADSLGNPLPESAFDGIPNVNILSNENHNVYNYLIPDDGKLRVVQFLGAKLLCRDDYDPEQRIPLEFASYMFNNNVLNVEIWGGADIDGDISGNVSAGGGIDC